ncbi:MAG: T9SS type A sorting domain-containing protein [Ignavibacteriae bacterium]|nr:T9SS C-terminal target domain-containing protein [Ignavibacteriota bacterium]NOG96626.1 T9SS type A sorting domain-containing protein [Ignavibacteriota bacterium]
MFKRLITIFILAMFIPALMSAQVAEKATKIDPASEKEISTSKHVDGPKHITAGTQLFFTDYDYAGNNSIPNMIQMYDFDASGSLDVFAVGMKRIDGGTRGNNFVVGSDGTFLDFLASDPSAYTGWGTMQVPTVGPALGKALIMGHVGGNTSWMNVDLTTFAPDGPDSVVAGNFPSFVYLDDGTVFVTNTNGQLYKTTDMGVTNQDWGSLDPADPLITAYNSEYLLKKSPNGMYIFHPSCYARAGEGGFGGVGKDSADMATISYSTDSGETWTIGEMIGEEGYTPVVNRTGYFPLFENFGQVNGGVDDNGVMHVTMNGYGYWDNGTDTTFAFPGIYWNSRDREWKAFTDEAVEQGIYLEADTYDRPGNGLGNAYPSISMTADGMKLMIIWQGPEYTGAVGTSPVNTWTPTGTDPVELHYTDLYYVTSGDGGVTWSAPEKVPGASEPNVQETFPYPNQELFVTGTDATLHYVYMVDAIPGTSLFDDNNSASNDSYWAYDNFTVTIATDINDNELVVNEFKLDQNYPNPFNPSTTISFTLPESGMVSLKVYDVLGKEVATLVNEVVNSGQHTVDFNAENLSTGIYFYELSAGEFVQTNKMMLIK